MSKASLFKAIKGATQALSKELKEDPRRTYAVTSYKSFDNGPWKKVKEDVIARNADELSHEMAYRIGQRRYPMQSPDEMWSWDFPMEFKATEYQGPGRPIPADMNTEPRPYFKDASNERWGDNMNYMSDSDVKWWNKNVKDNGLDLVPNTTSKAKQISNNESLKYENPNIYKAIRLLEKYQNKK